MPAANAEAMNEHLAEISTQIMPGAHAVLLLCDGAGWHQTGDKLRVPENIFFAANPALFTRAVPDGERLGIPAQQQALRVDLEQLRRDRQCKEAWSFLISDPKRIQSIGHREWTCVNL